MARIHEFRLVQANRSRDIVCWYKRDNRTDKYEGEEHICCCPQEANWRQLHLGDKKHCLGVMVNMKWFCSKSNCRNQMEAESRCYD